LKYMWRGQFVFTPGAGNARGCITLCPNDCIITNTQIVNERGHIFKVKFHQLADTITAVNLYAPTTKSEEKNKFFIDIETKINELKEIGEDLIVAGDFNTPLNSNEVHKRSFDKIAEKQAKTLKQVIERLDLMDCWHNNKTSHTWTNRGASSRLDRICYSLDNLIINDTATDWTICKSDHAAVISKFEKKKKAKVTRTFTPYLNTTLLNNTNFLNNIRNEVESSLSQIPNHWNPHMRLEFLKMTIRTAATDLERKRKKETVNQLKWVNEEIDHLMNVLQETDEESEDDTRIKLKLQNLFTIRNGILDEQGEELALKAKSKWYHEGERSNKYFLNILKRKARNCEISELTINNQVITNPETINHSIVDFYSKLYNQSLTDPICDELFSNVDPIDNIDAVKVIEPLNPDELLETLKAAKDSCPGPDGIPYSYIRALWDIFYPILIDSWGFSIQTKELPLSHKVSTLKLLPKTGKDLKELKNWRPITLSNCDFKLISKTYANRLTKSVINKLSTTQTAYLKNRTIHDNIRLIKSSILKKVDNGLIIALDAKKAFDSVRHDYIRTTLDKYGLGSFKHIFDLMYKDLRTDININGSVVTGYNINNGVKQGDALSCIIFILAIDPLIKNIEHNIDIRPIRKNTYQWPKAYGYADDITILIENDHRSVKAIFQEYEKFSKSSGLYLNADKTEIFTIKPTPRDNFTVKYCNQSVTITLQQQIKINGIWLHQDYPEMQRLNYDEIIIKIDRQFQAWSFRGLSLLGKILIIKTFGLSQIFYTTSSITLSVEQHKNIRTKIFKFLWAKNYQQPTRAVDRIKRDVIHKKTENGGFGLIDHEEIVEAINAKQYLASENPNFSHPIKDLIKTANSYFNRMTHIYLDDVAKVGALKINSLIENILMTTRGDKLANNVSLMNLIQSEKISNLTKNPNSIAVALLRQNGIDYALQITQQILNTLNKDLTPGIRKLIQIYIDNKASGATYNSRHQEILMMKSQLPSKGSKMTPSLKFSSKIIRNLSKPDETLNESKFLPDVDNELKQITLRKISKLKNTRQKNIYLRVYNNDIFSKEKLHKYGMVDSPNCSRCGGIESKLHLLFECPQVRQIWNKMHNLTKDQQVAELKDLFGIGDNSTIIKIKIEIIGLLINKNRPALHTSGTIDCVLNKLMQIENQNKTLITICKGLKQKLRNII